jgi:origin recognition complex subunit 4
MMASSRKRARSNNNNDINQQNLDKANSPPIYQCDKHEIGLSLSDRYQLISSQLSPNFIPPQLYGLDDQYELLYKLLETTLISQQNNACILQGYSGSGKSYLLQYILSRLRAFYQSKLGHSFVTIYLDGKYQSDDITAVKCILAQLSIDYEIEANVENNNVYLLLFKRIEKLLFDGKLSGLPIFFVLDNFDLFVARPKQTLLYCLSDLLQANFSQLALIGVSKKLNTFELLEKRIRSRMFYRRILFNNNIKLNHLKSVIRQMLTISVKDANQEILSKAARQHNEAVEKMLAELDFDDQLQHYINLGHPVAFFNQAAAHLMHSLQLQGGNNAFPTSKLFIKSMNILTANPLLTALKQCSILEITVLVALTHLQAQSYSHYNLAQIYHEYDTYIMKNYANWPDRFSLSQFLKAFDSLFNARLLLWAENSLNSEYESGANYVANYNQTQFRGVKMQIASSELEAVFKHKLLAQTPPTWLDNWIKNIYA